MLKNFYSSVKNLYNPLDTDGLFLTSASSTEGKKTKLSVLNESVVQLLACFSELEVQRVIYLDTYLISYVYNVGLLASQILFFTATNGQIFKGQLEKLERRQGRIMQSKLPLVSITGVKAEQKETAEIVYFSCYLIF